MANINMPMILGNYSVAPAIMPVFGVGAWNEVVAQNNWRWYLSLTQGVAGTVVRLLPSGTAVGAVPSLILSDSNPTIEFRFKDNPMLCTIAWIAFCTVPTQIFTLEEVYNQTN